MDEIEQADEDIDRVGHVVLVGLRDRRRLEQRYLSGQLRGKPRKRSHRSTYHQRLEVRAGLVYRSGARRDVWPLAPIGRLITPVSKILLALLEECNPDASNILPAYV